MLPKLGVDIVILLISFLLLSLLPCFNPLYFLKGTSFALLVSCQIQTLASPWSNSIVPKSGVLFTGSLLFAKESRIYHQVLHSPKVQAKDTVCLSRVSSMLAIAITITCNGGIHENLVGSGKGGEV